MFVSPIFLNNSRIHFPLTMKTHFSHYKEKTEALIMEIVSYLMTVK
jgi:hypothetical protein